MTLTIDQGNSIAKMSIFDGDRLVSHELCSPLTSESLDKALDSGCINCAIYSSVSHSGEEIIKLLTDRGVRTLRLTHDTPLPIVNAYATPSTLGLDRIAAAVGAWARHPGRQTLVVDIGTAVTYDIVTADGRYIGGNIAPGPWMRLQALHKFTARLPEVEEAGEVEAWGSSTANAMRSGAILGVVGELTYYRSQLESDAVIVITGGDSGRVIEQLKFEFEYAPNLVSEGLNRILQYNENI